MELLYKEESYKIIGLCMEVHKQLGRGLLEVVYKDALEYEFKLNQIPFTREKGFDITYKNQLLSHKFYADFIAFGNIILEIKACNRIADEYGHLQKSLRAYN